MSVFFSFINVSREHQSSDKCVSNKKMYYLLIKWLEIKKISFVSDYIFYAT